MNKKGIKILTGILAGLFLGGLIAFLIVFAKINVHGTFARGTEVSGVDVSGLNMLEAEIVLKEAEKEWLNREVQIGLGDQKFEAAIEDLGLEYLTKETLTTLKRIDARKISSLSDILKPQGKSTPILVSINSDILANKLEEEFLLSEKAPQKAHFYVDNGLQIGEEKEGIVIDQEKLIDELKLVASSEKSREIPTINISSEIVSPEITKADLEAQRPFIEDSIRHRFTLVDPVYTDNWTMSLGEHLDWVSFVAADEVDKTDLYSKIFQEEKTPGDDPVRITISIDQKKLNEFVDAKISKWLDVPVQDVNIYRDQNGKVIIEGEGHDGKRIERQHLKKAIELAVQNRIGEVPIPVINLRPKITISPELQELGIIDRLSVGHTSFYGSPANRVHNIEVSSSQFNGKLIAPDEIFSFNQNLGPVDAAHDYKMELVIKSEGTIPEYGGGICQVSTTFYRSILFAGLPVVDRRAHSYAVSYYSQIMGHGLDATIYLGGQDLKFKNDTGQHILIQTYTKNENELYVVFYGTPDGRSVEMEGPYLSGFAGPGATVYEESDQVAPGQQKQVQSPHGGFKALWYRHLTDKDGNTTSEPIHSAYRSVPAKILVGPGGSVPDPSTGAEES